MPSPDRHFATAAIFTQSTGLTPNSGDASLYVKSDNNFYIRDSSGNEASIIESVTSGLTGATQLNNIVQITQAGYNAIGTPSASTLYIIVG
jgi:hypothetical protein